MSTPDDPRGREFLTKVRPAAMTHLLAFFKESAQHLDPKTRLLISVVTKTINYSPRGLKQYIKRAMEAGASKDEVIDAIMCSYPCAGLTKVCDAAAVFLEMGLGAGMGEPAAAAPAPSATADWKDWQPVEGASKLADGESARWTVQGVALLIARDAGKLFALSDACPHRGGVLSEGEIKGGTVTCPLHGWKFHLKDGTCATAGHGNAKAYEIREINGRAEVRIPAK